jgi:hypothetical protein
MKKLELLKIELMSRGMTVTTLAHKKLTEHGAPLSLKEYPTTSGIGLNLGDDIYVNAPFFERFCKETNIALDYDGRGFFLISHNEKYDVKPIPIPNYYDKKNKKGLLYSSMAMTHTDRVRISPIQGCSFSCKFCDMSFTREYYKHNISDLIESIKIALEDDILPAKHVLISGGTPLPKDHSYIDQVYQQVAETFVVPVDVMMAPFRDLQYLERLYSWGINALSVNMELYDKDVARKYMPQKSEIGRDNYVRFIKKAVEVFGYGKVQSLLLIGLESEEHTLKGVETLASLGCLPVLSPFRPSPNTPLGDLLPPNAAEMIEIYQKSLEIANEYGVKLGPRCIPCHHNTLTFPDRSGFYFYS